MKDQYCIIGSSLAHSLSPVIFEFLFEKHQMKAEYCRKEADLSSLPGTIADLRGEQFIGANVTFPYKDTIIPLLDEMDSDAQKIGAVNTIVKKNGKLTGYNTDKAGFIATLRNYIKHNPSGKTIIILGAGGAARACLAGLSEQNAGEILVINRTSVRESMLTASAYMSNRQSRIQFSTIDNFDKIDFEGNTGLIVNATSAEKNHVRNIIRTISERVDIKEAVWFDLNYGPRALSPDDTRTFARCFDGLYMLAAQAAASFRIWTGLRTDEKEIYDYLLNYIARNS